MIVLICSSLSINIYAHIRFLFELLFNFDLEISLVFFLCVFCIIVSVNTQIGCVCVRMRAYEAMCCVLVAVFVVFRFDCDDGQMPVNLLDKLERVWRVSQNRHGQALRVCVYGGQTERETW